MTSEIAVVAGLLFEGVDILGMPVRCSGCGGKFHRLSMGFRDEPPMRGSYLQMIPRYRNWGWYAFPEKDWVVGDNVQCPQCGTPYGFTSVMRQVRVFVNSALGREEVKGADSCQAGPGMAEGGDGAEGGAQVAERRAEPAEVEFDETLVPAPGDVDISGVDAVADGGDNNAPAVEHDSIYAPASNDPRSIQMTVMRMTAEGCTQASIAKTCNMSVYMVRQIQNGRKV